MQLGAVKECNYTHCVQVCVRFSIVQKIADVWRIFACIWLAPNHQKKRRAAHACTNRKEIKMKTFYVQKKPSTSQYCVLVSVCVSVRYFTGLLLGSLLGVSKDELLSQRYCPIPNYYTEKPLVRRTAYVAV